MENGGQSEKARKASPIKVVAAIVAIAAAGTVMSLTGRNRPEQTTSPRGQDSLEAKRQSPRPRLLDLGAGKCIPCKMMAPVLEELTSEYDGRLDVVFVDVWQNPGVAGQYGIQAIPTQIFFDSSGKELYRHTGFFAKEDILKKWEELGVDLKRVQPEG